MVPQVGDLLPPEFKAVDLLEVGYWATNIDYDPCDDVNRGTGYVVDLDGRVVCEILAFGYQAYSCRESAQPLIGAYGRGGDVSTAFAAFRDHKRAIAAP